MPIIPSFLRPWVVYLEITAWIVWWVSLPLSKGGTSVGIVTLCILGAVRHYESGKSIGELWNQYKGILVMTILFFAYIIGLLHTNNLPEGIDFTFRQNPFLLVPFIFAFYADHLQHHLPRYLSWFIAANVFGGITTILLYLLPESQAIWFTEYFGLLPYPKGIDMAASGLHSPFIARIQFANLVGLSTFAACWLWTNASTKGKRLGWIGVLLVLLVIAAYLGARGAQLGLVSGMAVWAIAIGIKEIYLPLSKRLGRIIIGIVLFICLTTLIIGLPYLAVHHIPEVAKRYNRMKWELGTYYDNSYKNYKDRGDFTSVLRLISWKKAYEVVKVHPIVGVGTGDYYDEVQKRLDADGITFKVFAHHQFLQIWAMLGIFGLILFFVSWIYWFWVIQRERNFYVTVLAISFTFFYMPICLTDSALITQNGSTGFLMFFCTIFLLNKAASHRAKAAQKAINNEISTLSS